MTVPQVPSEVKRCVMRPCGLLPDLGAGSFEMRLDVLLILILVGHDVFVAPRFGMGFGQVD